MDVSREELAAYAKTFVARLPALAGSRAHVVGLRGNLGSGKTTFVQEAAKALGVAEWVTSPTFVIAQTYATTHPVFTRLVHIDAYRLEGEAKDTIGFGQYLQNPKNLILVEWPEYLPKEAGIPVGTPILEFETIDEETRRILEL